MYVYTCADTFEGMMSCIYDAWASRKGHANIRLELEPVSQPELFCEYVSVPEDAEKTEKVVRSIQRKISGEAYRQVYQAAMGYAPERLDVIYRFLILGFAYGAEVTRMMTSEPVMRVMELSRKTGNEWHYFREFSRFTSVDRKIYISHIEPRCNVLSMVAAHFADRMPSEHWVMVDDNRKLAAVHPKDEDFYLTVLNEEEMEQLCRMEQERDEFTDLWQVFFDTIGIEARKNPKCQQTMMPLRYRKHATEFM